METQVQIDAALPGDNVVKPAAWSNRVRAHLRLGSFSQILAVIAGAIVAFFTLNLALGFFKIASAERFVNNESHQRAVARASVASDENPPGRVEVEPGLSNRNIFLPAPVTVAPLSVAGQDNTYASRSFKLVGLAAVGENGEPYAMVENTQTKMTYVLQFGQTVEGIKLERIDGKKAVINVGGNSVELE